MKNGKIAGWVTAGAIAAAESTPAELESRVLSGSASLASDEAQLAYSTIYAPMAGTVVVVATIIVVISAMARAWQWVC